VSTPKSHRCSQSLALMVTPIDVHRQLMEQVWYPATPMGSQLRAHALSAYSQGANVDTCIKATYGSQTQTGRMGAKRSGGTKMRDKMICQETKGYSQTDTASSGSGSRSSTCALSEQTSGLGISEQDVHSLADNTTRARSATRTIRALLKLTRWRTWRNQ
jgi:hypothetical protein